MAKESESPEDRRIRVEAVKRLTRRMSTLEKILSGTSLNPQMGREEILAKSRYYISSIRKKIIAGKYQEELDEMIEEVRREEQQYMDR